MSERCLVHSHHLIETLIRQQTTMVDEETFYSERRTLGQHVESSR